MCLIKMMVKRGRQGVDQVCAVANEWTGKYYLHIYRSARPRLLQTIHVALKD